MKLNKISMVLVISMIMGVFFFCKKNDDDSNSLLLGAAAIAATGASEQTSGESAGYSSNMSTEFNNNQLNNLRNLIGNKTWYAVGNNVQIPKNLWGYRGNDEIGFCYTKFRYNITNADNSLRITLNHYHRQNKDCTGSEVQDISTPVTGTLIITPVSQDCFNVDIGYSILGYEGRGWVNSDGTELRLELYLKGTGNNLDPNNRRTPAGHRCENGAVGSKNSLTPDSEGCDNTELVCSPSSDATYNNVLIFDLTE